MWTRFNPAMLAIQKAVHEDDVIGDITCVYTDFSAHHIGKSPETHRVIARELGGGAILDLGPYPMVWVGRLDPFGGSSNLIGNDDAASAPKE